MSWPKLGVNFISGIDDLRCDLVWLHSGSEKDLAQRNAEAAERKRTFKEKIVKAELGLLQIDGQRIG